MRPLRPLPRPGRLHPARWGRADISAASRRRLRCRRCSSSTPRARTSSSSRRSSAPVQSEVEVIGIAEHRRGLSAPCPARASSVQALKAGIMEIPDGDRRSTRWTKSRGEDDALNEVRSIVALDPRQRLSGRRSCSPKATAAARACSELWEKIAAAPRPSRGVRGSSTSASATTSPAKCSPLRPARAKYAISRHAAVADDPGCAGCYDEVQRPRARPAHCCSCRSSTRSSTLTAPRIIEIGSRPRAWTAWRASMRLSTARRRCRRRTCGRDTSASG